MQHLRAVPDAVEVFRRDVFHLVGDFELCLSFFEFATGNAQLIHTFGRGTTPIAFRNVRMN
jgi:hypothetical protein